MINTTEKASLTLFNISTQHQTVITLLNCIYKHTEQIFDNVTYDYNTRNTNDIGIRTPWITQRFPSTNSYVITSYLYKKIPQSLRQVHTYTHSNYKTTIKYGTERPLITSIYSLRRYYNMRCWVAGECKTRLTGVWGEWLREFELSSSMFMAWEGKVWSTWTRPFRECCLWVGVGGTRKQKFVTINYSQS